MGIARPSKGKIRVLVADREAIFRLGVKKLFAVEDDLRVVGEAENAAELLSRVEAFQPDVVFVQEEILSESSGQVIPTVLKAAPTCKVVVTTHAANEELSLHHVTDGAAGAIPKSVDPQLFVKCVRRVRAGETWVPKKHVATLAKMLEAHPDHAPRPVDTLTRRERTIISSLMQGWSNREIGAHLSISEQTVKNHLRTIYDKVGVSDRLELVLYAIHKHLELPAVEVTAPPS